MKKFLLHILLILLLTGVNAHAQEENAAIRTKPYSAAENFDMAKLIQKTIETAKFFDEKYPPEKINEEMLDDIKAAFPEISTQQAYDMQQNIRDGLGVYRYFKKIYEKYKEKLLTPEEPPIVVDDDQYAVSSTKPDYIDSGDNVVVVTDIKTIVPYSQNPRDRKAIEAKTIRDAQKASNKKGDFDDLIYIMSRMELKKLPFYDILYPSPLTGLKGIGAWIKNDEVKARIITEQTGVKDAKSVSGLVHIRIPNNKFVIANNGKYHKPQINFSHSENLKNSSFTLPVPMRLLLSNGEDFTIYFTEIAIPVTFEVEDTKNPLIVKADIALDVCNEDLQCSTISLTPELTLNSEYTRSSSVATFIYQQHLRTPKNKSDVFNIDKFQIRHLPQTGSFLQADITSKEKISAFSVFIDNDDNIAFEAPRILIDGKKITVRFLPVDANTKLENHNFEITANLNHEYLLRQQYQPELDTTSDEQNFGLSWKLIGLAFIGGLLLNLMPCVLPVLSLKLLSLTKFGAIQNDNVHRNFRNTLLGIFFGMFGLATFLALLKWLGHSIGWGMQFQNPYFIISMIFAILLFILAVYETVSFKIPDWMQKSLNNNSDDFTHLLTGFLVVLMSTPCTAPYLGTAVGFALSGSIADIYMILGAVGLGLAFPYMLIYIFPALIILIPTPGPWMQKLNKLMSLMLFITLIWLFSILAAQTNNYFIIRLVFYVLSAAILLWLNNINREMNYENLSIKKQQKIKNKLSFILLSVTAIIFTISLIDGGFAYNKHRLATEKETSQTINIAEINNALKNGQTVIVAVGADWCLTCKYNNATVFSLPSLIEKMQNKNIKMIKIDWTNYNREVLLFMEKYHRSGLPFYILFSPLAPDGFVLPEILNNSDLENLISNFTLRKPNS